MATSELTTRPVTNTALKKELDSIDRIASLYEAKPQELRTRLEDLGTKLCDEANCNPSECDLLTSYLPQLYKNLLEDLGHLTGFLQKVQYKLKESPVYNKFKPQLVKLFGQAIEIGGNVLKLFKPIGSQDTYHNQAQASSSKELVIQRGMSGSYPHGFGDLIAMLSDNLSKDTIPAIMRLFKLLPEQLEQMEQNLNLLFHQDPRSSLPEVVSNLLINQLPNLLKHSFEDMDNLVSFLYKCKLRIRNSPASKNFNAMLFRSHIAAKTLGQKMASLTIDWKDVPRPVKS